MLLMIDNYDSFTFNLVHYFEKLKQAVRVFRNDEINLDEIERANPNYIVISPGPGRPEEAGITLSCIKKFANSIPILGVCLGHQAIAHAFGARIISAKKIMHGKTSDIFHNNAGVFSNIPNPFKATRYHSLVIDPATLSNEFEITAWTDDQEIMGIKHRQLMIEGVQFHPEAILTESGMTLLKNFIDG
ncbi:MAG: anthranilate/aminodeoxychorismate synthase component II [Gammaproteobacteria bacterium CG_4_10_14_0_8_um_filter_38_16]|nr:MAG: anthranilate/aminodeoxychorismate synthase component II [Gammaproteobacteria bacterium CG_4_10_14_0_8_um_filter_38_16]PJA03873.1 MAG: anthranilate/aminodeoxychorismate synthase component II [Gammaproteobacteria bacterium CG_4_10_14_0_2_um_filter_38_22]PJB09513.1 MAG: anthranilate/aminodeoxychorismate synthase component II [Gammaproteobacteria bacterium CG_4_9_14_3_um_filter_38_9]